jgi:hypothetical protein
MTAQQNSKVQRATADHNDRTGEPGDERDRKMGRWLAAAIPTLTVLGAAIAAMLQGAGAAIVVLAGGALAGAIAILWASVRTLLGEVPLSGADAYAFGAPGAEQEQKIAVVRALKDLELERSLGKISERDYRELVARYRAEAKHLLRLLDDRASPARARAEAIVHERLVRDGLADAARPSTTRRLPSEPMQEEAGRRNLSSGRDTERRHVPAQAPVASSARDVSPAVDATGPREGASSLCARCKKSNENGALFCNRCGARLGSHVSDTGDIS